MSEDSVFVVDVGSSSVKAGFSGDDVPAFVFPSTANKQSIKNLESIEGWTGDSTGLGISAANVTSHPVSRGVVKDWELMEKLWHNLLDVANLTALESTSMLVVESVKSTAADRSKWAEMLFETFHVPSICIANSATLSVFASGRTSGMVVESGAGITTAVPVYEGFVLKHAITYMDHGGQDVSVNLRKAFLEKNIQIDISAAKLVKERLAFVHGYQSKELEQTYKTNLSFCLPDGTDVTVESKVFKECSDSLFVNPKSPAGGLVSQVHESLILCDDSVKSDLSHNIILSGGSTMLPGFGDKLHNDLVSKFHAEDHSRSHALAPYIRVVPTTFYREPGYTQQRKYAPWIGGSLLGSFDTYNKTLKITRQEWEENADVVLNIKNL